MKYTSTVCAPCRQFSGPLFGTKHSQIVPRVGVGANYFRWGQLEYLEHCSISIYFLRGIGTANTLEVLYCGYCLYSKCFVFRYYGCIFACALGARYCSSYAHYSQYLGLLSIRHILAASTPILSVVLGLRLFLERLSVKPSLCYPEYQENIYFGGVYYVVCAISYSAGHKVL